MAAEDPKKVHPVGPENEKRIGGPQAQAAGDLCRCKETALMKPRQLLRLMIDDLAFWKKTKKG